MAVGGLQFSLQFDLLEGGTDGFVFGRPWRYGGEKPEDFKIETMCQAFSSIRERVVYCMDTPD